MKFYLVKKQQISFKSYKYDDNQCRRASVNLSLPQTDEMYENTFLSDEDCLKLRNELATMILSKRVARASEKTMVIKENYNQPKMNGILYVEIGLRRDQLLQIRDNIYYSLRKGFLRVYGDSSEDWIEIIMNVAKLNSCLATMQVALERVVKNKIERLQINEMQMEKMKTGNLHGSTIEHVHFPGLTHENDFAKEDNFLCELSIVVTFNRLRSTLSSLSLFPQKEITNRKILQEEVGCDLSILTSDGVHVKCHKLFLLAHSEVFGTMFKCSFKETETNVIEIPDLDEKSVRAFLEYLYYTETKEAHTSCVIAYDLLRAGHKYAIADLEDRMKFILLSKPDGWFEAELAVKLFRFANNIEGGEDLKVKAVKVIVCNQGELSTSEEYFELYKEDPRAAMELFKCATSVSEK